MDNGVGSVRIVVVNWQASAGQGLAMAEVAEPVTGLSAALAQVEGGDIWLCAWCLNRVASEKDRYSISGRSEFDFANPEGVHFRIITFAQTLGCLEQGEPTQTDTWFPGYAWSYCHCDRCDAQLGWFYSGKDDFAGLIRMRLARAVQVLN